MHSCPNCGQACDCIGDDLWNELEAAHCQCQCEFDDEDYWHKEGQRDWNGHESESSELNDLDDAKGGQS